MEFRWNASFSRNWSWQLGSQSGGSAERRVRSSVPVGRKLIVRAPFGTLRITGAGIPEAEIAIRVTGRQSEQIAGVACGMRENGGETELSIDVADAGGASTEVEIRVPRAVALEVHAGMGAVEISGVMGTCDVYANAGLVTVRLAPEWCGERVTIGANLGPATLEVPAGIALRCAATSAIGPAEVTVPSVEGAPPAKVSCNVGAARIVSL